VGFKPLVPPFKFLFSLKFGFVANAANPSGGHSVLSDGAELLRRLYKCVVKRAYIYAAKCNVHIADFVVNFQSGLH